MWRGYVREAGGGVVLIVVERDTESYPAEGTLVTVYESAGDGAALEDLEVPAWVSASPDASLAEPWQVLEPRWQTDPAQDSA